MIDVGDTVKCIDNDPFDSCDLMPFKGPTFNEAGLLKEEGLYTVSEVLHPKHIKLAEINSDGYFGISRFEKV